MAAESKCPLCGERVLRVALGMKSRGVDPRGRADEVLLSLDPTPNLKGANVVINGDKCGYVTNWAGIRHFKIPVYRRHGLHCVNPYGLKWKGLE